MKKGFTMLELLIIAAVVGILSFMAVPRLSDVKDSGRAAEMQKDLTDVRVALEKYYVLTEEYPKLVGEQDSLREIAVEGTAGKPVNFGETLEKRAMPSTPKVESIEETNKVHDIQKFSKGTKSGGWNYNQKEGTGEIHVNLPENIFQQSVDWSKQ